MRFLQKLLSNRPPDDEAVLVHFQYGQECLAAFNHLRECLVSVITEKNLGIFARHELAYDHTDGFLYMYGPDADELFEAIHPILKKTSFMHKARVKMRYGDVSAHVKGRVVFIDTKGEEIWPAYNQCLTG